MLKKAYVNGTPISREAVGFELARLVKFYTDHGMRPDFIKKNLDALTEKAQEQAIGAKLLLDRAAQLDMPVPESAIDAQVAKVIEQVGRRDEFAKALAAQKTTEEDFRKELAKGCKVDALVEKACSAVPEPSQDDVDAYYRAHEAEFKEAGRSLADSAAQILDLLRHEARGRAVEAYVDELREKATIEYK